MKYGKKRLRERTNERKKIKEREKEGRLKGQKDENWEKK